MKALPTLLAVAGLTLSNFAVSSVALVEGSCGVCDTFPSGNIGGSAQIPLHSSNDHDNGKAYKCTTFDKTIRLNTCVNDHCGLCMIFKDVDCDGEILWWGGPGPKFGGQGARSYFCM